MYCYFLCDLPCAIKVDGSYIGVCSYNLSFIERDKCFLEFIPLDESFEKVCFLFDKEHPVSTKNTKIIDLYGGFLLIPTFNRRNDGEFKMLAKKELSLQTPTLVTCFNQNGVKLCVSTSRDFLIESLPFTPRNLIFDACSKNANTYLLAICIADRTEILAFKISNDITLAFKNICDGYTLDKNTLTTVEKRNDVLKHTITSSWNFDDVVSLKNYTITRQRQIFSLNEKMLGFAFFEELLIDGDLSSFLAPNLKPRADEMKEFLGDFKRVLPSPHFKDDDLIALLYNDRVEYVQLSFNGGLISNVVII